MKTHLEHLLTTFPDIFSVPILDIGAGRGSFMIEAVEKGGQVKGIEFNLVNISMANNKAFSKGVSLDLVQGMGENLPYDDASFGFVNICEVIEHVESPKKILEETYRVLKIGGQAYLSAPNRYGIKDQHFHVYLINWLPRKFADKVITFLGKDKDYDGRSGFQRLSEMHYFTHREITNLAGSLGFKVGDIRKEKLDKYVFLKPLLMPLYFLMRTFILDSFHLKLIKI